jgi:archaellum component FlaF (FlaF/FlaG flagellin family)
MNLSNVGRAGEGMSFPAILARPSNGNVQNTTNNNSQSVSPVINVNFTNNGGALSDADLLKKSHVIAKAVRNEIRNFNQNSRPRI